MLGKQSRKDVQEFERDLMTNILSLHQNLVARTYSHSLYQAFKISDPKPRDIHKASVRDRLLHHALHRKLSPFFAKTFISDSYSCQIGKGTHRALRRFGAFSRIVSKNNTRTAWVLKCDIKKFFANIDHITLMSIIGTYIHERNIVDLLTTIVGSFDSGVKGVGLPLGNLTSQLLVNIYMNEFDQFVKHKLKAKWYIRYADDFVVLSHDCAYLKKILLQMQDFLNNRLKLSMHPQKISIKTVSAGVDFLGWIHFLDHCVLRTATKKRMFRRIGEKQGTTETVHSYLGLLRNGNSWKLQKAINSEVLDGR